MTALRRRRRRWAQVLAALSVVATTASPAAPAGASIADTTISTIAGTGIAAFGGDGGPAAGAALSRPLGVAVDRAGNTYVGDGENHRVRRIDPNGIITTVAGSGVFGFGGDGGPATAADLTSPNGIAVDGAGSVLFTDSAVNRIRRVDPGGTISTVAGTGPGTFAGDGGPAAAAALRNPKGVAIDPTGGFYVADTDNHRIRHVDAGGTITTVAGTGVGGFSGDGGPATAAALARPAAVAVDPAGGFYIVDTLSNRVRRVDPAGTITTVAGGGTSTGPGLPATSAKLAFSGQLVPGVPFVPSVALDPNGDLVFTDPGQHRVARVGPDGRLFNLAGTTGSPGFTGDGGPAVDAKLNGPFGIAVPTTGRVVVADTANNRVRAVQVPPIAIDDVVVQEGTSGTVAAALTVTTAAHDEALTVAYTTADGTAKASDNDYVPTSGTLTLAPGELRKTITVLVVGDTDRELDEAFTVRLTSPGRPGVSGTITVLTDDLPVPNLSVSDTRTPEGLGATFTVTKAGAATKTVTVDYAAVDGTGDAAAKAPGDYTPTTGTLTFAPAESTKTVTVPTIDDAELESPETFGLALSNATSAKVTGRGTATIVDDLGIVAGDAQVAAGTYAVRNAVFPVRLFRPSTETVTVDYSTADGTVTAPAGYTPASGTLSFAPGETLKTVVVSVNGALPEAGRTFILNLSHPTGMAIGRGQAVATIVGSPSPRWLTTDRPSSCFPANDSCNFRQVYTVTLLDGAPCRQSSAPAYCGKLLVAGGIHNGFEMTGTAQLYDPATGTWSPTGSMAHPRYGHTATALADGRVLVVGGNSDFSAASVIASAELYDPTSGIWSSAGERAGRSGHSATVLANGKVLIAGGATSVLVGEGTDKVPAAVPVATTELFDPTTFDAQTGVQGSWRTCSDADASADCPGPMITPRNGHAATLLADGEVLAASGGGDNPVPGGDFVPLTSSEVYNPATGRWRPTGPVAIPRFFGHAELLSRRPCGSLCDEVLLIGAPTTNEATPSAELYDPDAISDTGVKGVWSPGPTPPLNDGMVVGLPNGKVLYASRAFEILYRPMAAVFDPATSSWSDTPEITIPRDDYTLAVIDGPPCRRPDPPAYCGRVLAGSGWDQRHGVNQVVSTSGPVDDAEVYVPAPVVNRVTPAVGPSRGGTSVVITGSGFAGLGDVRVGDVPATSVHVDSDHQITAVLPPHPSGPADVVVTSVGGTSSAVPDDELGYLVSQAPGVVGDLAATVQSDNEVELAWSAPASDGTFPPPAGHYVVKVSKAPITDEASFAAAPALCSQSCAFSPAAVGDPLSLGVGHLSPGTTYHFALRAVNEANLSGPLSTDVVATTSGQAPSPARVPPTTAPATTVASPTAAVVAATPTTVVSVAPAATATEADESEAASAAGSAPSPATPSQVRSTVTTVAAAAPTTVAPSTTTTRPSHSESALGQTVAAPSTRTRHTVPGWMWALLGVSVFVNLVILGALLNRRLRPPPPPGRLT